MPKLFSIGLLSAALFTVSASPSAYARPSKAVRSPDPSVKCDKCRQWVRVPSPGSAGRGQPGGGHYWKRAPICPECDDVAQACRSGIKRRHRALQRFPRPRVQCLHDLGLGDANPQRLGDIGRPQHPRPGRRRVPL
jgi:hypothetical protein